MARIAIAPLRIPIGSGTHSASASATKNKFVHLALQRTLALATERRSAGTLQNSLGHGLDITIVGDNDFYSQRAQVCSFIPSLHRFPPLTLNA